MKTHTIKPLIYTGLGLMFGLALSALPTRAQDGESKAEVVEKAPSPSLNSLVRQLREAVKKGDIKQAESLVQSLAEQGEAVVPALNKELQAQNSLRGLIFALGQIRSDASTDVLLTIIYRDSDVGSHALGYLVGRPIPRPLSPEELKSWTTRLQTSNAAQAATTARILSFCSFNDVEQRAKPIIARFIKEALNPQPASLAHLAYLSEPALNLNQFVLALSKFNDPTIPGLLQQKLKSQTNPTVLKWLTIGLGFVGDSSVSSKLRSIVEQEKDGSTKAVALRAYCRVAQEDVIPLLKTCMSDKNVTGQSHTGPYYGVQLVARAELLRLQAEAKLAPL